MKIRFRQTGGFAGLVRGCDVDTASLSARDSDKLLKLVKQANLAEVAVQQRNGGRDLVEYEISIEREGTTVSVSFDDMNIPANAEALLDFLRNRAGPVALE